MDGKIITYDNSIGKGTIITKDNEKIEFTIDKWNDFDNLPKVGHLVIINNEGLIVSQKDLHKEKLTQINVIKEEFLNILIANGWKILNNNLNGFIAEKKDFDILSFLFLFTILSIILSFILGFWGAIIALILIFVLKISYKKTILVGKLDEQYYEIKITKNDKIYKKLIIDERVQIKNNTKV